METTDKKRDSSLLSYHTFIYPFIWNDKTPDTDGEEFEKMLKRDRLWHLQDLNDKHMPKRANDLGQDFEKYKKDWYLAYKRSQYFNKPARALIFGNQSNDEDADYVVRNYILRPHGQNIEGKSKYVIVKTSNGKTEEFVLSVSRIKLKLYSTGSALMIFDMEYYGEKYLTRTKKPTLGLWRGTRTKKPTQKKRPRRIPREVARRRGTRIKKLARDRSLDAVNKINEYGRRVTFPYLQESGYPNIVADSVELDINVSENGKRLIPPIKKSFLEWHEGIQTEFARQKWVANTTSSIANSRFTGYINDTSPTYIFKPIRNLLPFGYDKEPKISPLIDDRMYVCCLLLNPDLLGNIGAWNPQIAEYRYLNDCNRYDYGVSTELYKFAFIEESPSCMSHSMRKQLLRESVYDRWIDHNTIYVATDHSFLAAHTAKYSYLVDNFLHLYIEVFLIALIQRATLLALSSEASSIAGKLNPKNPESLEKALPEISNLYKEYVKVNSHMMLTEVTSQEQGIEMYNLFLKQLYIEKHKQALDQQLNNLYEVSNIESNRMQQRADTKLQSMLRMMTYVGLFLAMLGLFPFVSGAYSGESLGSYTDISHMLGVISAVLLAVIAYWKVSQDEAPKQ